MAPGWIYVPKLKAAPIATLAEAMGKTVVDLEPLRVGGEKRDEKLLSTDELSRVYDIGFAYAVRPALKSWDYPELPPDFRVNISEYSSHSAAQLSAEELKNMLTDCHDRVV
jgi:FlaA1/EpsC-like NDP-sugar epimerase